MLPFCTTEKEGFRHLVETLDPRYEMHIFPIQQFQRKQGKE